MVRKKLHIKYILAAGTAVFIAAAGAFTSYADEAIKSVSVTVTSSVEPGSAGFVSAASESSKYHIVSCDFTDSGSSWKAGEIPKVSIELDAEEGYYFNSISSGSASVKGAVYVYSSKSTDKKTLTLTVKLKPVKGALGDVEDAYWTTEGPLGRARWDKVDVAGAYELKLYCNDSMVYRVARTNSTVYNFFPYMTEKGTYYFRVRAVAKSDSEADYLTAGEWKESDDQEVTARDANEAKSRSDSGSNSGGAGPSAQGPGWSSDNTGWWYRNEDGTYPVNSWKLINGKWYLFNMDGYMLTGWQKKGDREYYLTSNGDMVSGWFQYNRTWYYLDPDRGKLSGGWLQLGQQWYYLNPDGSMAAGWLQSKGNWYYLNPGSGEMVTNKTVEGYYVNPDGVWIP